MADLFTKVSCTYCQEEINGLRVQCCVCTEFDICLQCFASGAEIGPHKNDHSYKVVYPCAVKLFGGRGNWTGQEELLLLSGVESYGFGHWEAVSRLVETKTPDEVRDEYISRYLEGNIGKATWAEVANNRSVLIDHVPDDNGPLAPEVTSRLPPLDVSPEDAKLLDYKPHRDDFEREYDMEAEQLVCKLQLDKNEDTNMEVALKLAMVDIYTRRLRERARRKRIVRDYQLVNKFFSNLRKDPPKKQLSKEQRELREKMRVFAQFFTSGEHERLIASMERQKELHHRLEELLRYRSLGLMTQEEIIHYEQHAAFQKQQQRQSKAGSSGYAIVELPSKDGNVDATDRNSIEGKSTWLLDDGPENNNYCSSENSNSDNVENSSPNASSIRSLLSLNEMKLCSNLNLQPVQYVTLKSGIIQENFLQPMKINRVVSGDKQNLSVKDAVTQYLICSGWLPEVSPV